MRIGIVSWNTAGLLGHCLDRLPAALGGARAEVVVVDNDSGDDSAAAAGARDGVTVMVNPCNVGYARAMNQALSGTTAPVLLALNPDTDPPPGSLERLVGHVLAHPRTGLAAPLLTDAEGVVQQSVFPYPGPLQALETNLLPRPVRRLGPRRTVDGPGDPSLTLRRRWVIGAVHCMRSEALGGRPPYSDRWFMYAEDLELCWRLQQQGWTTALLQGIAVVHHGSASAGQRWGRGAELELRSLPNLYEWLWTDRSPTLGRAAAAVNAGSIAAKRMILYAAGGLRPGERGRLAREKASDLGRLQDYHGRVLAHGPDRLAPG